MKRESKRGGYIGDIITPENRREYIQKQAQAYKEQYLRSTPEDQRKPEKELEVDALGYGRYRANRELKHFKNYLKGKSGYKYKGDYFPIMTGEFIKEARQIERTIEINKVNNKEEEE